MSGGEESRGKIEGGERREKEDGRLCVWGGTRRREFLGYYSVKPLGIKSSNIPNEHVSVSRYPELCFWGRG